MAINDNTKLDVLWKKVVFGTTETSEGKAGPNESVSSPPAIFNTDIYTQSNNISKPAPASTDSVVYVNTGVERIECIVDISVAGSNVTINAGGGDCTWTVGADTGDCLVECGDTLNIISGDDISTEASCSSLQVEITNTADVFKTVQADSGSDSVASGLSDTLDITGGTGVTTVNSGTGTITINGETISIVQFVSKFLFYFLFLSNIFLLFFWAGIATGRRPLTSRKNPDNASSP